MPSSTAKPSNTKAAIRQARRRKRRKLGHRCVQFEMTGDDLDALYDAGLCAWNESGRDSLTGALREIVEEWKEWKRQI